MLEFEITGDRISEWLRGSKAYCGMLNIVSEESAKSSFPNMSERWMTQVVPKRYGLPKISVELEHIAKIIYDLCNLQSMDEARAKCVIRRLNYNLRLVRQLPEGVFIDDFINVMLEQRAPILWIIFSRWHRPRW
jgi:hypothetical protein